jgi:hypothetical protein
VLSKEFCKEVRRSKVLSLSDDDTETADVFVTLRLQFVGVFFLLTETWLI